MLVSAALYVLAFNAVGTFAHGNDILSPWQLHALAKRQDDVLKCRSSLPARHDARIANLHAKRSSILAARQSDGTDATTSILSASEMPTGTMSGGPMGSGMAGGGGGVGGGAATTYSLSLLRDSTADADLRLPLAIVLRQRLLLQFSQISHPLQRVPPLPLRQPRRPMVHVHSLRKKKKVRSLRNPYI
jgi:hypothetical protein